MKQDNLHKGFIELLDYYFKDFDFSQYESASDVMDNGNMNAMDLQDFVWMNDAYYSRFYNLYDYFNNKGINPILAIHELMADYISEKL